MQPEVRIDTSLITVSYAYDSLYRLTAANYSDGNFFHYTYDAEGNRLTETTRFGTNTYVYDAANRLVSVNAVNYTWDNNGNLLSDGEYTYTYDHANRLKTVTDGVNTSSYAYNGLGDRVSETVNEITTDYVLDLAGGLTQVLADGTNSYLYGNARIMQEDSNEEKEYFLGDALGSVRMLADEEGEITLLRSYEPYGEVLTNQGSGETSYAFTGEQYDPQTGLVYLRARYYSTASGRFMSRDTWTGNSLQPQSLNGWGYVESNPVNRTDPSGTQPFDSTKNDSGGGQYYRYDKTLDYIQRDDDELPRGKSKNHEKVVAAGHSL
jgi:RHS repeat-associated protein